MATIFLSPAAARIALLPGSSCSPSEAAEEAVDCLQDVVPYASASLFSWDPVLERHRPLANVGYSFDVLDYLSDEHYRRCRAYQIMRNADPRPTRWRDNGFDYSRTYPAEEVFTPAGYREGLTACLFTQDGRYTGALHLSTETVKHPDDDARDAIECLQPIFAALCDVTRSLAAAVSWLEPGAHAVALTPDREMLLLPGHSSGPHLDRSSALVAELMARWDDPRRDMRFLWRDEERQWHKVRLFSVEGVRLACEVATSPPHGLTARELEVLSCLAAGSTNREIAAQLFLSIRTVNTHVEHLLAKLECASRAACVGRAIEEGLILVGTRPTD
jgi:DNA-binding CsgD family transcriptional regulator